MTETATAQQSAIGPLAAVLGRDILAAMVQQVKLQPDHWHRMNEATQAKQIDQMRGRVREIVMHAVRVMIGGGQFKSVGVELESLTFKDGLKGQFVIPKGADGRHELADAVGGHVLIVLADANSYMQRMEEVKEAADQLELFGGDYDPTVDQPAYRRDEKEDRLSPARMGLMSWADLKKRLSEGVITKEQAEKEYGGPLPDKEPPRSEDEVADPLDFLDNVVGPVTINAADLPPELNVRQQGNAVAWGPVIELTPGETLRQWFLNNFNGCTFHHEGDAPALLFGKAAEVEAEKIDARAELGAILERLFALGYTLSLGALQALEPEQMAQIKAWDAACRNTAEDAPLPSPPEWLPKNEPGENPPDNQKE